MENYETYITEASFEEVRDVTEMLVIDLHLKAAYSICSCGLALVATFAMML